jgi:hypothetical protein
MSVAGTFSELLQCGRDSGTRVKADITDHFEFTGSGRR